MSILINEAETEKELQRLGIQHIGHITDRCDQ